MKATTAVIPGAFLVLSAFLAPLCVGELLALEGQPMTVKELREKLAQFDDGKNVNVYWENRNEQNFFDIENLSTPSGTAKRVGGKKVFEFGPGFSDRVFINVIQD
jgi:hypothetical protein